MARYQQTFFNDYLKKSATIKADSLWEFELKKQQLIAKWQKEENKKREREAIQSLRLAEKEEKEFLKNQALKLTKEAQKEIEEYKNILQHTLTVNDKLDWNTQYKKADYPPFETTLHEPKIEEYYIKYNVPAKTIFEYIFPFLKRRREKLETQATQAYNTALTEYKEKLEEENKQYLEKKQAYEKEIEEHNKAITDWKNAYEAGEKDAVEKYVRVILENSKYPASFNKDYEIQYDDKMKTLIVSYNLPNPEQVPKIIEHKFVQSSKTIKPVEMKKKEFESFYENIIFQVTLRTIHEVFEADYANTIDAIVFNGWVTAIDKATGNEFTSCIISLHTTRKEFMKINLARVDCKECIRNLKGLVAGALVNLPPVKPILDINKEDKRFVESKDILAEINSIENLATMDWADFEHLVRQLFEKMFTENGAEVKVTRASRDGGVDAVVFDPDPIRGGKFIIQAKRYNNVVPVSAVRDLYGTVINEGATKGILVTTSYFGSDSVEFAKDKPLTLIDGSNLVYLFQQYGYNVRISLDK
jgi:restriction system protein